MMELERRDWQVDRLEIRGHGDGRTVRGQAVPINRLSEDLGGFREVIRPGAVSQSVKDNDIFILWQHDTAQPISKTTAKRHALIVEERKTGVWFEQAAAAFTEFQLSKIDDGVVDRMSFGFFVEDREDEKWHNDQTPVLREIFKMNLKEISPVTFAAYQSTTVAVRSAARHGIILPKPIVRVKQVVGVVDPKAVAAERKAEREKIRVIGESRPKPRPTRARPVREYPSTSSWNLLRSGPSEYTIRATAFHEAGHAVAGFLEGLGIHEVCVHSRRQSSGAWRFAGGECQHRNHGSTALSHMAGEAAEILSGCGLEDFPPKRNREAGDTGHARAITKQGVDEDLRAAQSLLKHHWSAVAALARRLMAEQRVDGPAAEALILDHLDMATRSDLRQRGVA